MCPSTRSLPSWGAPRPRRGSWRAGPAAGSKGRLRFPTPISPASERSSTPSWPPPEAATSTRSEEHTSELQSHHDLVCRLLLEKKKNNKNIFLIYIKKTKNQ